MDILCVEMYTTIQPKCQKNHTADCSQGDYGMRRQEIPCRCQYRSQEAYRRRGARGFDIKIVYGGYTCYGGRRVNLFKTHLVGLLKIMGRKKKDNKKYLINDVAQVVGLSQKRIREYEKEGLVKPSRESRTNNRIYVDADIIQISRIKQLIHEHGFTLSCLRYFLASAPCWVVFDCAGKRACPAYKAPHTPCYEIMEAAKSHHIKKCQTCLVFMNREVESFSLFEKKE